jgi:prevent-host-death family protein
VTGGLFPKGVLVRQVSVTEARRNWSRLLAAVEAGESVIITRHGRPVARLAPPGGAARFLDRAALRAGVPPMRDSAGESIAKLRDDERY